MESDDGWKSNLHYRLSSAVRQDWDSGLDVEELFTRDRGPRLSVKRSLEPFLPFVDHRKNNGTFLLRPVDEEWIDLENTICGWLSICEKRHKLHCTNPGFLQLSGSSSRPQWLLDANNWCLVPATKEKRYFALSYVWGTVQSTSTTLENLDALQKKDSLLQSDVVVPQIVLDVLHLIKELGEAYLWVGR